MFSNYNHLVVALKIITTRWSLLKPLICAFYCAVQRREPPSSLCSFMRAAGRFLSRSRTPNVSQTLPECVLNSGLCHQKRRWKQSPARLLMKISNLKVHNFCTVLIYCSDTLQLHLFPYLHDWRESAQLTHHWQGLTFCDQDVIFLLFYNLKVWVSPFGPCAPGMPLTLSPVAAVPARFYAAVSPNHRVLID